MAPFTPKPYSLPIRPASAAIQGSIGSFSHAAMNALFNDAALHGFETFEEPFDAVHKGKADVAVIPIQNTIAGPVPYVHRLIRNKRLHIIGEYFLPIEMCIMTLPGVRMTQITHIHSHIHALNQCKGYLERHSNIKVVVHADTAGAAKMIADLNDPTQASISPAFAAQFYPVAINQRGIQDNKNNVTRFVVLSPDAQPYPYERERDYITSLLIKPRRSLEYPLFEILKIFKDHGLEPSTPVEYQGPLFRLEDFFLEVPGHARQANVASAIEFIRPKKNRNTTLSSELTITGVYPLHHARFGRGRPKHHAPV